MNSSAKVLRVVVVGGGVVGCATACELAQAGFAVTLLERDTIAGGASGRNAGKLNPLHGASPAVAAVALEAFRAHARLRACLCRLDCGGFGLRPLVRLHLGDDSDAAELQRIHLAHSSTPDFDAQWLNEEALTKLEPRLSPNFVAGVLTQGALSLDGAAFTHALAAGAERLGAHIIREGAVGLDAAGGRVTAVRTSGGALACDAVVFATGPSVVETETWLGVRIPVESWRGDLILLRLDAPSPPYDLTWRDASIYLWKNGLLAVGEMHRDGAALSSEETSQRLIDRAAEVLPAARGASLVGHLRADRPMTVGGEPIAARAPGWGNVFIANGGGSKGVLLSALIANTTQALIAGDRAAGLGERLLARRAAA
jgi:glycine oxidase